MDVWLYRLYYRRMCTTSEVSRTSHADSDGKDADADSKACFRGNDISCLLWIWIWILVAWWARGKHDMVEDVHMYMWVEYQRRSRPCILPSRCTVLTVCISQVSI